MLIFATFFDNIPQILRVTASMWLYWLFKNVNHALQVFQAIQKLLIL